MPDLIETIEREIRQRADELKPTVDEYQALERARKALDESIGPLRTSGPAAKVRNGRSKRRPASRNGSSASKPRKAGQRAGPGERTKTIIALLESNPEITAANIALLLDITPNNAHATIYRLRKQGRVDRKRGRWVVNAA